MGIAARIRGHRVKAGKTQAQIAELLGIDLAWYSDLEQRDEELASTLTLFQAMQLASILGVRLHALVSEAEPPTSLIALTELPAHITDHISRSGISLDALGQRVGWDLSEVMTSPLQCAAELPLAFYQALARELGIEWLSLVPEEDAQ